MQKNRCRLYGNQQRNNWSTRRRFGTIIGVLFFLDHFRLGDSRRWSYVPLYCRENRTRSVSPASLKRLRFSFGEKQKRIQKKSRFLPPLRTIEIPFAGNGQRYVAKYKRDAAQTAYGPN